MELRKDYILDRWVMFSDKRKNRPFDFVSKKKEETKKCNFCVGNESKTPETIYELVENNKWKMRVISNLYPAVDPNGNPSIQTHNRFYTFSGSYGKHEILIETTQHGIGFATLSKDEIKENIKVYNLRINELLKDDRIKYVCFYKNQGEGAGASIDHAHSQIIALSFLPTEITDKISAIKKYDYCPYCEIIKSEKDSYRRVNENDSFVAFCPYASQFNYELWILPKNHKKSMNDFSEKDYDDLADIYKKALQKLEEKNIDYDVDWYYSPENENLHFHVEIKPRIQKWAGFEIGYGVIINEIMPEDAAKFYRGEQ
jgi:UDPglucose--hexose-1-phosphate uridylyltransferase